MTRPKSAACTFSDHLYSMPSSFSACCRATWIWWSHGSSIGVAKIAATFSFLSCANAMPRQRGSDEPHAADLDDIAARGAASSSGWSWFFPLVEADGRRAGLVRLTACPLTPALAAL